MSCWTDCRGSDRRRAGIAPLLLALLVSCAAARAAEAPPVVQDGAAPRVADPRRTPDDVPGVAPSAATDELLAAQDADAATQPIAAQPAADQDNDAVDEQPASQDAASLDEPVPPPADEPADDEPAAAQDVAASDQPVPLAERPRPADARALLAGFARVTSLEARFREEKRLALLAVPLVSTGRLHFLSPGYLARVVETPEPARLLITPDSLRMTDRDGSETIDLRSSDALRLFVTSLVQVFSGDEQALVSSYTLAYDAPAESAAWTLTLTPKAAPLTNMLRSLSLAGTGQLVQQITVTEPNGDRAVTTLEAVDPGRVYDADERRELFGIDPPR